MRVQVSSRCATSDRRRVKKSCVKIMHLARGRRTHVQSAMGEHQTHTCLKHSILSTKRVCELPLLAMQRCWMAGSVWALDVSCALDSWVGQLDLISLLCDLATVAVLCVHDHTHTIQEEVGPARQLRSTWTTHHKNMRTNGLMHSHGLGQHPGWSHTLVNEGASHNNSAVGKEILEIITENRTE